MRGEVGLCWRMNLGKSLAENAGDALRRHEFRYKCAATVINANPEDLKDLDLLVVEGIMVIGVPSCLKGHLFVGRKI